MGEANSFALAAAAGLAFTVCGGTAVADNANASGASNQAAAGAPTKDALVALEVNAHEAWKSKNAAFWNTFLADNFVGWGPSGRLDKRSAAKVFTGSDCDIKSYAISEAAVSPRGKRAALITYKATVDGTCGGEQLPVSSWAASVYIRDHGQWKAVFHSQAAVVDPAALAAKPDHGSEAQGDGDAKNSGQDPGARALLPIETAVWEAWKDHDGKRLSALMAEDISFINIFGTYLPNKTGALKNWSGSGCEVKSISVNHAVATMLSPRVGVLTFNASADGTCFGQRVGPIWGSSIYVKYGDAWTWTFGINVPAGRQGS